VCPANQGPPQYLVSPTEYEDKECGVSCYLAHQVSEDTELRYFAPGDPGIAVISSVELGLLVLGDQQGPLFDSDHRATGLINRLVYGTVSIGSTLVLQAIRPSVPHSFEMEHRSRCEGERTLREGQCEVPGEIEFRSALLCARHAKQAEIHERIDLLHGIVLSSELCLRTVSLRGNGNRTLLLRCQRARATRELDLAHEELRRFENNES
jgi:hypothetical protein